jgi:putative two-component system response regulator
MQEADVRPAKRTSPPVGAILIVEDDAQTRAVLVRLLTAEGYEVHTAIDGESALASIAGHSPDLILLDVGLPGLDGFEVCRSVKRAAATRLTPVIMVTGMLGRADRIRGINAGADDFLAKPFDVEELRARVRSLLRLKRYTDDLDSAESIILSLALTIEARDSYTGGHCQRLAGYATALGESMSLGNDDLDALHRGGYLHDIGKIAVADAVLQKAEKLNADEFEAMKLHTIIGERLCGNLRTLVPVRSIVRHHHERLDGTGYPDGLAGDQVPLLAQIVSIADTYDAITTTRPYRAALSPERAYDELTRDAADGVRRRDLVEAFIALGYSGRLQHLTQAASPYATIVA